MTSIVFGAAWPLWMLAGIGLVAALAWRERRSNPALRHLAPTALLRCLTLACIALALAAPSLRIGSQQVAVVYALDISHSVSPAFVRDALAWMRAANAQYRPAQARYVVFADQARLVQTADDIPAVAVVPEGGAAAEAPPGALDQRATNLESALLAALFAFTPEHARHLVLLSDGNQTEGDVWRMLPRLRDDGVRLFTLPAAPAAVPRAVVERLVVPEVVHQQAPVELTVRVSAIAPARVRVEVRRGDALLGARSTDLVAGENDVALQVRFARAGANDLSVRVLTGDGSEEDSALETVWVSPRPRVLYVEGAPDSARYLAAALTAQGIQVEVATAEQLAGDGALLDGRDALILSDVAADRLGAPAARRLETFVRDRGAGLIFAAGESTYGKAGFARSDMERLLPVKFEARRKRKDLDLVLLIDRSFSMRGRKLELAKSAALATLDLLEDKHRLAVIAFDARPHDVVALAEVGGKRRAEDAIASMTASGQTNLFAGLQHAYRLLKDSPAKTRHVILLSDGVTAPPPGAARAAPAAADSEAAMAVIRATRRDNRGRSLIAAESEDWGGGAQDFPGLAAELAARKITLSTVAIGEKPNLDLMTGLAQWAQGRSYIARNDAEIPGLFVTETRRLLGESLVEESFRPVVKAQAGAIAGIDFAAGPPLKGYAVTRAKRFSEVLLEARQDQPLLVQTRYGLGKTVAFLSDVKNRWAIDWLTWPGYSRLWAQVVRDSARRAAGEELAWRAHRAGREALLTLSAYTPQGDYRNGLSPRVRMLHADGQSEVLALRQVAPGTYRAQAPLAVSPRGPVRFELLEGGGIAAREARSSGMRSLHYPRSDEYRRLQADTALLQALSEQTGGAFAPETGEIFRYRGGGGAGAVALWPLFAGAALLLYLLEIAVRRWPGRTWREAR